MKKLKDLKLTKDTIDKLFTEGINSIEDLFDKAKEYGWWCEFSKNIKKEDRIVIERLLLNNCVIDNDGYFKINIDSIDFIEKINIIKNNGNFHNRKNNINKKISIERLDRRAENEKGVIVSLCCKKVNELFVNAEKIDWKSFRGFVGSIINVTFELVYSSGRTESYNNPNLVFIDDDKKWYDEMESIIDSIEKQLEDEEIENPEMYEIENPDMRSVPLDE